MISKLSFYSCILLAGFTLLSSCSEDENIYVPLTEPNNQNLTRSITEEGRFDNTNFQWDYFYSTDSLRNASEGVTVYPVKIKEDTLVSTRATTTNRRSTGRRTDYRNNGGSSSRRSGTSTSTSNILISDPNIIYVGAAFPESEFGKNFSKELVYPRNPIDISTSFPDSYIGEITKETGGLGYKKFLKEVLKSAEYKNFIQNGGRESLDFQCTEYFSYSDIEKAFSSNAGLAKIFSAKVQSNSRKTNIKSRLLGQLISRNFTITMEVPAKDSLKINPKIHLLKTLYMYVPYLTEKSHCYP